MLSSVETSDDSTTTAASTGALVIELPSNMFYGTYYNDKSPMLLTV